MIPFNYKLTGRNLLLGPIGDEPIEVRVSEDTKKEQAFAHGFLLKRSTVSARTGSNPGIRNRRGDVTPLPSEGQSTRWRLRRLRVAMAADIGMLPTIRRSFTAMSAFQKIARQLRVESSVESPLTVACRRTTLGQNWKLR